MKNTAFALLISLLVAACSSGTTVSDLPQNVTSRYQGTFQNTPGTQSGGLTLDLAEDSAGTVGGNILFQSNPENCLSNAPIMGSTTGFNMNITADQTADLFTTATEVREADTVDGMGMTVQGDVISTTITTSNSGQAGTSTSTDSATGRVTTTTTERTDQTGVLVMQFTISNGGNSLNGTYVMTGDPICNNEDSSGTMVLSL